MKKINEMTIDELWAEMTDIQKTGVYRKKYAEYIEEDVISVINSKKSLKKHTNDEKAALIKYVIDRLVYSGKEDADLSYWDNIHCQIERFEGSSFKPYLLT